MGRENLRRLLLLAIGLALFPQVAVRVAAIAHYVDIMVFAGIFSLVALGLSLLMGYAGQVSLAQAAFFGIGAYSSGILSLRLGWNPWAAMPMGCVLAAIVAWLVGVPALRLKGHYLAMATLGFGVIVSIVLAEEVNLTGGPSGLGDIPRLKLAGKALRDELQYYYLVWSMVVLAMVFSLQLIHSRVGRALRAIHSQEGAAEAMGVPTARYKVQVFVMGAVLAALGGSLYAHYVTFLNPPSFNVMWSIRFLLMVVVGGMHSIWGALLGTVLMTFIGNEWLQVFADYEIVVYGGILLLVALFLPQGLVSLGALWHSRPEPGRGP